MVEWSITAVLKTAVLRGTGGSNPSLSALEELVDIFNGFFFMFECRLRKHLFSWYKCFFDSSFCLRLSSRGDSLWLVVRAVEGMKPYSLSIVFLSCEIPIGLFWYFQNTSSKSSKK